MPQDAAAAVEASPPRPRTLIAAAHGTASPDGQATVRGLIERVGDLRPELPVRLCFLDVLGPGLAETLNDAPDAVVVPMLLCTGFHVQQDIPVIMKRFPLASLARHLGPDRALSSAVADRLAEVGAGKTVLMQRKGGPASPTPTLSESAEAPIQRLVGVQTVPDHIPVALVGNRSSVPAAAQDLAGAAADLADLLGRDVFPIAIHDGLADEIAERNVGAVATYLLAEGYFLHRMRTLVNGMVPMTDVIGDHVDVAGLILRRYDEAVSATL